MSGPGRPAGRAEGAGSFLGSGWSFPPSFLRSGGTVEMSQGVKDIEESLVILLSTELGERLMRPDYGCDIRRQLFEPLDATATAYVKELVNIAILYHEPRIDLTALRLVPVPEEGRMDIVIDYVVRNTNSGHNFVFPYYIREGTNLKR
jgi:hypothetical protein